MSSIVKYIEEHHRVGLVARLLVGALYLFSSVSKAIDPYGTVLKVEEYLYAMGAEWMSVCANPLAVGLIGFEMLLGAALILNAAPRLTARVAVVVGALFTLFTLWVAVANPVAECGCFGDVVVLTNAQTFGKNVVLLLLSLVVLCGARNRRGGCDARCVGAVGAMVLVVALCIYSLVRLPLVDRFPFGVGTNIPQSIADELQEEESQTSVVCRSVATGEERHFAATDEAWWNEQEWEFVRVEAPESGVKVRARDFRLMVDDHDLTAQILTMPLCRLVCVERVEEMTERQREKLLALAAECMALGNRVVVVSASPLRKVEEMFPYMEICNMDAVTLRALLRAPYGIVTLKEGTVMHKATLCELKVEN